MWAGRRGENCRRKWGGLAGRRTGGGGVGVAACKYQAPILLVGPVAAWQAESIVKNDLRVTVRDEKHLNAIASHASMYRKVMPVDVELDTGSHRMGFKKTLAHVYSTN